MKNRGTWILFGVVIALSLYTYFGEYKGKENEVEKKVQQSVVFKGINVEQVNSIEINNLDKKVVLNRGSSGWEVKEPTVDLADSSDIDTWLKQLVDEKTMSVAVEGADIKWQYFGFDKTTKSITLKTTASNAVTVEVSDKKNFEGNSFIRYPGENKVMVAGPSWSSYVSKKVFDVRNKQIFRHQVSNVQQVQIRNKSGHVVVENKDAKWITPKQTDLVLDQNSVRDMIAKINEIRASEFVGEKEALAAAKKNLKLGSSVMSIEIKLSEGFWNAVFYQAPDKAVYAEIPSAQLLVKIPSDGFDKLMALTTGRLRDFKLPFAAFDKYKPKKLLYETSLKKAALVKTGNDWVLDPADSVNEVQQDKVSAIMETIKNLAAVQYVSKSEIKKDFSKQKVVMKDGDDRVYFELQFSESDKKKINDEEKTVRYAKTNLYVEPFMMDESEFEKLKLNEIIKIKTSAEPVDPSKSLPAGVPEAKKHEN